ncbi:dihydroorotase [Aestuariivivens sediminicola]|uniref:dihydroorotase n=1 Tax=Aestuariivivens sediminicola TaxID=2913560 RepID=UPI001F563697|nr:dihydroorotase [Aestuariivivens sediminicola]
MNVLIKSATIIDPESEFHNTTQDVLIEKGVVTRIGNYLKNPGNYKEIQFNNLHISQGWFDSSVSFGEPGYEERETITNGLHTAALSGFTAIALNADTNPIIDTNADIAFVLSKSKDNAVTLLPMGALTSNSNGTHLAELFDMKSAGAVAFYDYKKSVSNPNLMKIALQYASNFSGLVCSFPLDQDISRNGVMNEHVASTKLGLKGNPALAEELQVSRDLFLLEYTGGKLHIPTISTARSVALIKEAKAKKLDVSCSVAIHNLCFTDDALSDFNTNFKVQPPLRTQKDIGALIDGLKDGTIDMVTSDHSPIDIEEKKLEFDRANYGTIGLESAYGALQTVLSTEKCVEVLTRGKSRFGVQPVPIAIGNILNATLFNPDDTYVFEKGDISSKSKNAIFEGAQLKGRVYGIFSNNKLVLKK